MSEYFIYSTLYTPQHKCPQLIHWPFLDNKADCSNHIVLTTRLNAINVCKRICTVMIRFSALLPIIAPTLMSASYLKDATPKSYLIEERDIKTLRYNSELYSDYTNHCYRIVLFLLLFIDFFFMITCFC